MTPIKEMTVPYAKMLFVVSAIALFLGMPSASTLSVALAEPIQGPKGQSCKSTGTTTVNGTQDGKAVKCTADYCKSSSPLLRGRNAAERIDYT
jgi:hypothetical protein